MANTHKQPNYIESLAPRLFWRVRDFFFPDDTKLKIEASTDVYLDENGELHIHRRFFTFRAFANFAMWYVTKNPYEKAKKYLNDVQENPAYAMRFAGMFAVFLLISILDIKNISNVTLIAGAIAYDAQASTTGSTSPITFSHTTSGSDRGLVVTTGGLRNPTAITYNSVSMTEAKTVTPFDTSRVECWTLIDPASGSNTVSCTLASDGSTGLGAVSFSGVDSFGNTAGSGTLSGTTLTNTIYTKKANSFIVESQWKDNATSITQNSSQTELFDNNVGGSRHATAYSQLVAAGGVALQFTGAGSASLIGHALVEVIEKTATTQISLDATSFYNDDTRTTSHTFSHTCAGTNRVLVVNIFSSDAYPTGVTYNGVSMTSIASQASFGYQRTYILVAPATGANNIVVSFSGNAYCSANAISLNGANGYGNTAAAWIQDDSSNDIITAITISTANSWTIENQQSGQGSGSALNQVSSQGKFGQDIHTGNGITAGAYKSHASTGSVNLSYALNWNGGNEMQRHVIVEITAGDQATNITVTPSTQAATFSTPTYSTAQGITLSPSTQAATFSIPTYATIQGLTVSPSTQIATFSIPTYDVLTPDVTVSPNTVSSTFSVPTYSVVFDFAFGVNTQSATFSIPTHSIALGQTITPSTQEVTFSIPIYSLAFGIEFGVSTQSATFSIPTYTVIPETRTIVNTQSSTFSVPVYSVLFGSTISPDTQVATFSLPSLYKIGAVWTKRARQTNSTWSRTSRNSN